MNVYNGPLQANVPPTRSGWEKTVSYPVAPVCSKAIKMVREKEQHKILIFKKNTVLMSTPIH